jgi:Lipopolysaccharide export system permease LptF/LptG
VAAEDRSDVLPADAGDAGVCLRATPAGSSARATIGAACGSPGRARRQSGCRARERAFGLIAVALGRGGRLPRRPLGLALLLWFVIVFAYYVLFYGGRTLATEYMVCPPWLGAWSANILFAAFAFAAVVLRLRRPELSTAD